MRKNLLLLVLMTICLGLVSCGKAASVSISEEQKQEIAQTSQSEEISEPVQEVGETEDTRESDVEYTFFAVNDLNTIYIADGVNFKKITDESDNYNRRAMNDKYIVFADGHNENNQYYYDIVLYDIEKKEGKTIFTVSNYFSADIYQNVLYVSWYDYSSNRNYEKAFDLSRMEETDNNQNILNRLDGYQVIHYKTGTVNSGACYKRMMDTNGYVPLKRSDDLYAYGETGITKLTEYSYWMDEGFFERDKIIYSNVGDGSICCYDFEGDAVVEQVSDSSKIVGVKNGKIFYLKEESPAFLQYHYSLCAYDFEKTESKELIDLTSVMGNYVNYPLSQGFTLYEDYIYFLWDPDGDVYWYRIPNDGEHHDSPEQTENLVREDPLKGKGYKVADSKRYLCDSCGRAYYETYGEYVVLDDEFIPGADTVNQTLKTAFESALANEESYNNNECEAHEEGWGTSTYEMHIYNVRKVSESILEVDYSGYWYGGGVHGEPLEWHRIFDAVTGKKLKITDIYKGSEEEFKTVVAEKTMELFDESNDDNRFYATDAEGVYQDAYESVSFDTVSIELNEDMLTVIFNPYEMGPYASGFIYVNVDYASLGIELY